MSLKRWVFAADSHGDKLHEPTAAAFQDFLQHWKPHLRVHGGDLFNFDALRRKANENEKRQSVLDDLQAGFAFLRDYRPNVWLLGNHDDRLYEIAKWGSGAVKDLAVLAVQDIEARCRKIKCAVVPFGKTHGVYQLGNQKLLHGYFHGITAAKQHAQVYGRCLFGHIHAHDLASIPRWEGPVVAQSVPALCQLEQEYNRQNPGALRHSNGWAYGVLDEATGETETWIAREIGGKWLLPTL